MGKISIFGLGYVGSVTAACLASKGHSVIGVDLNTNKVEQVRAGQSPVVEPQMDALLADAYRSSRLSATTDAADAVRASDISLLCVGTPSLRNGKLDVGHIEPVCREIGAALGKKDSFHLVVLRSTVLPGTAESLVIPALERSSGKSFGPDFGVCVNPEFMREGSAVADFLQPSITVLGSSHAEHAARIRALYDWAPGRVFETSFRTAEMVKYLSNAWHALKVAFANEAGCVANELGVDVESAFEIFCADTRLNISRSYLAPGFAFGGSCLPKDLRALNYRARELDLSLPLLDSILTSNEEHVDRALEMILSLKKKKIAMLGLSFKPSTDDLRDSAQVQLVKQLIGEGCQVAIWDDAVLLSRLTASNRSYIEQTIAHIGSLLCHNLERVVSSADVVVIGTTAVPRQDLERYLRPEHYIIDLVNLEKSRRPTTARSYQGICWRSSEEHHRTSELTPVSAA